MGNTERKQEEFDLFLSHATPDKEWVLTLAERLEARGLRVFVDSREIAVGDNFVLRLSDDLKKSRYIVLVLPSHTGGRPWIAQEWTSFVAGHGPPGTALAGQDRGGRATVILKATQAMDATDRDATRAADELFKVVGDPSKLPADDARWLVLGRDLVFTLSRDDEQLSVIRPDGSSRTVPLPWKADASFGVAHLEFGKLHRKALTKAADRVDLFRDTRVLGSALFETLFDEEDAKLLTPDRARPVVQIRAMRISCSLCPGSFFTTATSFSCARAALTSCAPRRWMWPERRCCGSRRRHSSSSSRSRRPSTRI